MNKYFITPLLALSIYLTAYAMENPSEEELPKKEMPKLFQNLPWEQDLREIVRNRANSTPKKYESDKEMLLMYAVDQYERKNNKELSPEERNKLKETYLENASKERDVKISDKKTKHKHTKKAFMSKSMNDIPKTKKKHSKSMLK